METQGRKQSEILYTSIILRTGRYRLHISNTIILNNKHVIIMGGNQLLNLIKLKKNQAKPKVILIDIQKFKHHFKLKC